MTASEQQSLPLTANCDLSSSDGDHTITVSDEQSLIDIDPVWIRQTAVHVLNTEHVIASQIDIALVNDAAIHVINRQYLDHDEPTDVISFLLSDSQESDAIEGQLVISVETAIRSAEEYGWRDEDELRLYVVHGLLHLCGYDDQCEADQRVMRTREIEILQSFGIVPHYG